MNAIGFLAYVFHMILRSKLSYHKYKASACILNYIASRRKLLASSCDQPSSLTTGYGAIKLRKIIILLIKFCIPFSLFFKFYIPDNGKGMLESRTSQSNFFL